MHGCCRSFRPRQRPFALALENENHDEQGENGNSRCDDCSCSQAEAGQEHSRHGGRRGPADGLSETHEGIEATLFPDRREVDRHAVDRDILGCCETVDEHADQHQKSNLFHGILNQHECQ